MSDVTFADTGLRPLPLDSVVLGHGIARDRRELTREYAHSLKPDLLLLHHNIEAARVQYNEAVPADLYGGWEGPLSMVRSHTIGHWMTTMAWLWATTKDPRARGNVEYAVSELDRCQQANGGEWVFGIPEKYLYWLAKGRAIWAPTYICHKTLMGLFDAYRLCGSSRALEIVINAARWFTRFTDDMSVEKLDDFLDWETGGIQELWADLYGVTGEEAHLELVRRFDRRRLIDRLLAGEDALTNMHANQTIPEILGAARAFEVTGDGRWHDAVLAYWRCAVSDRGAFATGGQTFGEFWSPPNEFGARLGRSNQEHCVVFNMMRLAEKLLQWTGDEQYAGYIERNRYNGLFAQQHPRTGMVTYYLPLHAGATKTWSTATESFWCCVATMLQAGARYGTDVFYTDGTGVTIAQYIAATASCEASGTTLHVDVATFEDPPEPGRANFDHGLPTHRPNAMTIDITVRADTPVEAPLRLRLPAWLAGPARLTVDGVSVAIPDARGAFHDIALKWSPTPARLRLELPTAVHCEPIPDRPNLVAFLNGPVVLAGLIGEQRTLVADARDPSTVLLPTGELELGVWRTRYTTQGQSSDFDLVPLHEVTDQPYTVYFPVVDRT